jgi:thymidylate synthase
MVNMRSQSAVMVLPYDVFTFSFLQEVLAVELGLRVGQYFHNSGSFHYYLDEEPLVQKLLIEPPPENGPVPTPPVMPAEPSPFAAVALVLQYEARARDAMAAGQPAASVPLPVLPRYWTDVALLLAWGLSRAACERDETLERQLSAYWVWVGGGAQAALFGRPCEC